MKNNINDILDFSIENNVIDRTKRQVYESALDSIKNNVDVFYEYLKYMSGKNDLQEWIEANRVIRGKQFSYENADIEMMLGSKDNKIEIAPRPYLRQYINDNCRDKTIIKCRQSELTESEINENIWLGATINHCNIRHIYPTGGMANRMAKEKISPAIEDSPNLKRLLKKPYNMTSKEFINGSFYTVDSSWTDHGGRGPSSDKITFDEYESQNPHIEEIYSESTSHSNIGRRTRISTPMFPNSGIDLKYNQGAQFEWWIVCPKCGKEQVMEFPESIINYFEVNEYDLANENYTSRLDKTYIGCKFCMAYIDRTTKKYINTSKWIARKNHMIPSRTSYRITYMMLPWKTGKEILYKYHSFKFTHQFWNEIMGYAYIDPTARINRSLFESCIDNSYKNSYSNIGFIRNVSIGVDWGVTSWVVVRGNGFPPDTRIPRIIYIEKIDKESLIANGYQGLQTDHALRVADIMVKFNGRILINDANGIGVDRNSYLVKRFPTRAWGVFYDTEEIQRQKHKERLIQPKWNQTSNVVTVSRVGTFKMLIQEYENKKIYIPQLDPTVEEFILHHSNIAIQMMQDEKTEALYEIVGHTGPDHLAHSDNYSKIGFDKMVNLERQNTAGIINNTFDNISIDNIGNPDLA